MTQNDRQITNAAEDMSDAADTQHNIKSFTEWLSIAAISDACYSAHPNGHMYKHDMNAIQFLYILENPSKFLLSEFFNKIRNAPLDTRGGNYILQTYIFVMDCDEIQIADFENFLKCELEANFKAHILSEFVLLDYRRSGYKKISGGKLQDKSVRKILEHGCSIINKENTDIGNETHLKKEILSERIKDVRSVRNNNKTATPFIILLLLNVIILVVDYIFYIKTGSKPLENIGIQSNEAVINGEWWRLITSIFLHADVGHLAGNMLMLVFLNRILKNFYTDVQYWIIYLLSGITGSLFTLLMGPQVLSLGASGAVMGLGGALFYRMFFGKNAKYFRHIGSAATIVIMVVYNLIYGLSDSGINNYAHFSGFAVGFIVALIIQILKSKNKK